MGYEYFGSSNKVTVPQLQSSAPFDLGRTTTHEVGHWLGLRHIWGDGGCGVDDFVADTPEQASDYTGCPNATESSCNSLDMWENFMDYTDDNCMGLFSAQQVVRMNTVLEMDAMRDAMIEAETPSVEIPTEQKTVAYFQSGNTELCTPSKIEFNSSSYVLFNQNADIDLVWKFEGGNPATASTPNVEVEFEDFGTFDVQLIAISTAGSDTILIEEYVKIERPSLSDANELPFIETFEGTPFDNSGWIEQSVWELADKGNSSLKSIFANNFDNDFGGEKGEVITPKLNLENTNVLEISFDVAYAPYSETLADDSFDSLAIYLGDGCGNKTFVWQLGGKELATADSMEFAFIPKNFEWSTKRVQIEISDYSVGRIYFTNIGHFGNNIYLDNVEIRENENITFKENETEPTDNRLLIFPNPNNGNFSISLENLGSYSDISLTIFNHLGVEVYRVFGGNIKSGRVSVPTLKNGIYVVRVETSNGTFTRRIVVDK